MPVQAFSFPVPETRFFQAGRRIFKFKITRGGNYRQGSQGVCSLFFLVGRIHTNKLYLCFPFSLSGEDMTYDDFVNEELEVRYWWAGICCPQTRHDTIQKEVNSCHTFLSSLALKSSLLSCRMPFALFLPVWIPFNHLQLNTSMSFPVRIGVVVFFRLQFYMKEINWVRD